MENIVINQVPRQTAAIVVDGHDISIDLFEFRGIMYADVSVDGNVLVRGARCIHDEWLTGSANALADYEMGNLKFICADGVSYPYYTEFGASCRLCYFRRDEL